MLKPLRQLFRPTDEEPTQEQREALLDLLLWTMYADHVLALSEHDQIDEVAEAIEWTSVTPIAQYLNAAVARIRDVIGDAEATDELLERINERLATDTMRRRAYEACYELAESDGEIASAEINFLHQLRERFGIERSA